MTAIVPSMRMSASSGEFDWETTFRGMTGACLAVRERMSEAAGLRQY